jgi:hypothetical protein
MRNVLLALLLLCLPITDVWASTLPDSVWQQGTLASITTDEHTRGSGYLNGGAGYYRTREIVVAHYTIDTPAYRYEANLILKHRRDHQLNVTVNGPLRFAFTGKKFYIIDEDGKQHELDFVQKIKK